MQIYPWKIWLWPCASFEYASSGFNKELKSGELLWDQLNRQKTYPTLVQRNWVLWQCAFLWTCLAFFDSEKDELVGQIEIEDKRSKQAISFSRKETRFEQCEDASIDSCFFTYLRNFGCVEAWLFWHGCGWRSLHDLLAFFSWISWLHDPIALHVVVLLDSVPFCSCPTCLCMCIPSTYYAGWYAGSPILLHWTFLQISVWWPKLWQLDWPAIRSQWWCGILDFLTVALQVDQGEDEWLQCEHRRLAKLKNRHGILDIQNHMIALQESKRSLNGIVHGFWDDDSSHGSVSEEFGALESADSVDSASDTSLTRHHLWKSCILPWKATRWLVNLHWNKHGEVFTKQKHNLNGKPLSISTTPSTCSLLFDGLQFAAMFLGLCGLCVWACSGMAKPGCVFFWALSDSNCFAWVTFAFDGSYMWIWDVEVRMNLNWVYWHLPLWSL